MKDPNKRFRLLLDLLEEMKQGVFTAEDLYHSEDYTDEEKRFLMTKFIEHKNEVLKRGEIDIDLFASTDPIERQSLVRTWGTKEANQKFSPIEDDHFAIIAGQGGCGKTAFTFFLAQENSKVGLVYYLSLEMSSDGILTRLARESAGITKEQWRDKSLIAQAQVNLYKKTKRELRANKNLKLIGYDYKPSVDELFDRIREGRPHIAFIDNLDLICIDESEKDPQKVAVEKIKSFTKQELIPIVLIHHMRKGDGRNRRLTGDDMRGSAKIRDNIDTLMICNRMPFEEVMPPDEKAMFMVMEDKDRSFGSGGFHTYYFHKGGFYDEFIF